MTVEPLVPFPVNPYCRVRARVASIWADGPDSGIHPDWRPAAGEKVTLTPSIGSQLLAYDVAGPEPIILTVEQVDCVLDKDGWLTKSDGRPVFIAPTDDPLLSVTGWTWTAVIKGKSVVFAAPSGGVVNLALFIAAPATGKTQMWVERIPELVELLSGATVDPETIATAVADYLAANPVEGVTVEDVLAEIAAHVGEADPHPQYVTASELPDLSEYVTTSELPDLSGYVTTEELSGHVGEADPHPQYVTGDELPDVSDVVREGDPRLSDARTPTTHDHDGIYAPVLGPDDNYISDAEKAALHSHANKSALDDVSGVNTGDQDLSGYATTAALTAGLADKADATHSHELADITDYTPPDLSGYATTAALATVATSGAYADLTGQPDLSGYATTGALTEGLAGKADEGHSHAVESMTTGSMDTGSVLAPDGVGGVGWVPAPSGGGGGSDPWVYSVVSAEATSDGSTDLANIPGLSIPAGLTAGVYQVKYMILSKASGGSQSYAFTSPTGGNLHIIAKTPQSAATVPLHCRVAAAIANPITLTNHMNAMWGAPTLMVEGTLVVPSLMTSAVYLRYGVLTQGHTLTILPGSYLAYRRIA